MENTKKKKNSQEVIFHVLKEKRNKHKNEKSLINLWNNYKIVSDSLYKVLRQAIMYTDTKCSQANMKHIIDPIDVIAPFWGKKLPLENLLDNLKNDEQKEWVLKCLHPSRIKALEDIVDKILEIEDINTENTYGALGLKHHRHILLLCSKLFFRTPHYDGGYCHRTKNQIMFLNHEIRYNSLKNCYIPSYNPKSSKRIDYKDRLQNIKRFGERWFDIMTKEQIKISAETFKDDIRYAHFKKKESFRKRPKKEEQIPHFEKWKECMKSVIMMEEEEEESAKKRKISSSEEEEGDYSELKKSKKMR